MRESTFGIVQILLQQHMPDEAIGYLEEYLRGENAKDSQGKEFLARAYLQMRRYVAARSQLKEILGALQDDEDRTARERSRLLNNIAVCHASGGERQRAVELLEAAVRMCPTCNVTPYWNLSRIHLQLGENGKALEVLAASKRNFPEDQETRLLRAAAFEMLDLHEQSLQELEELGALKDAGPAAYAALGGQLVDLRSDFGRGIAVLKEGHGKFPRDPVLINNLAYALLMKGDVVEARRILELAPRKKERWSVFLAATWGLLRLKEGDVPGGANLYREAEELASRVGNKRLACAVRQKMHLELARLYLERKNYEGAWHEAQVGLKEKDGSELYRSSLEEAARQTRARWGFLELQDGS
jgi:tetratricopeptide (TPR) repeat protein